ncbi:MAG: HEPN domain-containing protein [Chloroflexi bacterium]|nr:HEPN domain-containing protein [Chloroflexota bacterium]
MERSADWLDQAESDLRHAAHDMEAGFYDWACFSAQQSAEKALKSVFQRKGTEARGNSVADLLDEMGQLSLLPPGPKEQALELDKAYIPTRYPNANPSGSPRKKYARAEASRLVDYAREIILFCKDLLSQT